VAEFPFQTERREDWAIEKSAVLALAPVPVQRSSLAFPIPAAASPVASPSSRPQRRVQCMTPVQTNGSTTSGSLKCH